jgi:hypothetical protein
VGDAGRNLQGSQLAVREIGCKLDAIPLQGELSALPWNERWQARAGRVAREAGQIMSALSAARSPESSARPLPRDAIEPRAVRIGRRIAAGQVLVALLHGFGSSAEEKIRSIVLQF